MLELPTNRASATESARHSDGGGGGRSARPAVVDQRSRLGARTQLVGMVLAALMVWGGQVKQIPPLNDLPVDFTLAATFLALAAAVFYSVTVRSSIRRDPLLVLVLLFALGIFGAVNYVATDYALDKTLRYFLLTWTSAAAVAMLVRDQYDSFRFLKAVLGVALGLSLFIAIGGEREYDETLGRLTTSEGGTILFGQACGAVVVATAAWLMTSRRLSPIKLAVAGALVAFEIWTMFAIASKGPIQAVAVATIAMIVLQIRRLNPTTTVRIFGIIAVLTVALFAVWDRVPLWSRERLLQLASGNSAGSRLRAWTYTWSNVDASPFGNGWGSWDLESPVRIGYPHNIILEIWYEAGLLGLIVLLAAIVLVAARLLGVYEWDRAIGTLAVGLVVYWLMAAQVSSDVNGNKLFFAVLVAGAAPIAYDRWRAANESKPTVVTS